MNRPLLNPFDAADLPKSIHDYLELEAGRATCMRFNRHGNLLAVGTTLGSVVVWDFDTHTVATVLPSPALLNAQASNEKGNGKEGATGLAPTSTTSYTTTHTVYQSSTATAVSAANAYANPVTAIAFPAPGNAAAILVAHRTGLLRLFDTLSTSIQTELNCPFVIHALETHPRDSSVAIITPLDGLPHMVRLRLGRYTLPETIGADDENDGDNDKTNEHGPENDNKNDNSNIVDIEDDNTSSKNRTKRGRKKGPLKGSRRTNSTTTASGPTISPLTPIDQQKLRLVAPSSASPTRPHFQAPPPPPTTTYANKSIPKFKSAGKELHLAQLRTAADPPQGESAPKQHHLSKRRLAAYTVLLTRDGRYALRTGPGGLIHVFLLRGVSLGHAREKHKAANPDCEKQKENGKNNHDGDVDMLNIENDTADPENGETRSEEEEEEALHPVCVAALGVPGNAFIRSVHLATRRPYLLVTSTDKCVRLFEVSQLLPRSDVPRQQTPQIANGASSGGSLAANGGSATNSRNRGRGSGTNESGNGNSSSSSGGGGGGGSSEVEEVGAIRGDGCKMLHPLMTFTEVVNRTQCRCAVFSGDGDFVLGGMDGTDHRINIWRVSDGHLEVTLEGPKEGIVDLLWHPVRPVVASLGQGGAGVYVWAKNFSENWSAFATQFAELEANEEYVEREDEFDVVDEEDKKSGRKAKSGRTRTRRKSASVNANKNEDSENNNEGGQNTEAGNSNGRKDSIVDAEGSNNINDDNGNTAQNGDNYNDDDYEDGDDDDDGLSETEREEVDIEMVNAAWFDSDSDDGESFFYVPAVPQRESEDQTKRGLADEIMDARMGSRERGMVIDIGHGGKVARKKRARGSSIGLGAGTGGGGSVGAGNGTSGNGGGAGRPRKTRARAAAVAETSNVGMGTGAGASSSTVAQGGVNGAAGLLETEHEMHEVSSGGGGDDVMVVGDG